MLLKRVSDGEDPAKVREDSRELLASVGLKEMVAAERHLLSAGVSFDQLRQFVYAFAKILGDQAASLRANVGPNHLVRLVLAEHEMLECFLADLKDVNDSIQQMNCINDVCSEFRKLCHIANHLLIAYNHHQREEDIIFPALKGYPCYSLCRAMQKSHFRIISATNNLLALITNFNVIEGEEFKTRLDSLVTFLVPAMREHLFQEDNILYPIALEVLNDDKTWKRLKEASEDLGYCGFDGVICYE